MLPCHSTVATLVRSRKCCGRGRLKELKPCEYYERCPRPTRNCNLCGFPLAQCFVASLALQSRQCRHTIMCNSIFVSPYLGRGCNLISLRNQLRDETAHHIPKCSKQKRGPHTLTSPNSGARYLSRLVVRLQFLTSMSVVFRVGHFHTFDANCFQIVLHFALL